MFNRGRRVNASAFPTTTTGKRRSTIKDHKLVIKLLVNLLMFSYLIIAVMRAMRIIDPYEPFFLTLFFSSITPLPSPSIIAMIYSYFTSSPRKGFVIGVVLAALNFYADVPEYISRFERASRLGGFIPGEPFPYWTPLLTMPGCGFMGYSAGLLKKRVEVAFLLLPLGFILWLLSVCWWWKTMM